MVKSLPWHVTSSHRFRRAAYVNVQELAEVKVLLEDLCNRDLAPGRFVNGVDSRVVLGCWAKGRSSSFVLNGILRASLGWLLLERKWIDKFWLASADNPADDPSRFVKLRDAVVPLPGLELALQANSSESRVGRRLRKKRALLGGADAAVAGKSVRLSDRCVREVYSGRACSADAGV